LSRFPKTLKIPNIILKDITDKMLHKMSSDITDLKDGLDPQNIAFWYKKVIAEAKEMAPPWLVDKIGVKQDPILYLKFNLDISKRAVRYLMMAIENNLDAMPYATRLYFLKVQELVSQEMDKALV
jgi:hypothetical protein